MSTPLAEDLNDPSIDVSKHWQIVFEDGSMLIDNKAPNEDSGWHRLRSYLKKNPKKIKSFTLQYMNQGVIIQGEEIEKIDGIFYFSRCASLMGAPFDDIQKTIGIVRSGTAYVYHINRQGVIEDIINNIDINDPRFIEI